MTTLLAPSRPLSSMWWTRTLCGCFVAKQIIVNREWFSQVSILFDLSSPVPYLLSLLVNPGNNFPAFQAAATGNSTSNTTASATSAPATSGTGAYPGSATATPSSTSPQVHQVVVGGTGKLFYSPSNITAQVGDVIQFQFQQKNHTITQVRKICPCTKIVRVLTYICSRHLQALAAPWR